MRLTAITTLFLVGGATFVVADDWTQCLKQAGSAHGACYVMQSNGLPTTYSQPCYEVKDFVENDSDEVFEAFLPEEHLKRWKAVPSILEYLKIKARILGLWNLWLSDHYAKTGGEGFTNVEYGLLCEILGRSNVASEALNCSAPDTELVDQLSWRPTLQIVYIVFCKSDGKNPYRSKQHSIVLLPSNTPGLTVTRPLKVYGFDDAPHGHYEVIFNSVRVQTSNIILGEGRGFEVMQGRMGPGRIHHCKSDASTARAEIGMCKILVPTMACTVLDRAIQTHGGGGISQEFPLARIWSYLRTTRLADGRDEAHIMQLGQTENKSHRMLIAKITGQKKKVDELMS
ncbi:acyl-CoA dehydrogenase [Venturia nashicola]|uniref:Acyl-CoA dehydrogenase n=1 Tax=Venturia nashicola TaxID=86259 RepID=A0A4Z1PD93_9PEZI|nr:acyl-CoA dehydrogenase [Venturia nashicola]